MKSSGAQAPAIVVGVDCSDWRRDEGNTTLKELVESSGGYYYRIRNAGPTILMGWSLLLSWLMLAPLLKKGARIVIIKNHHDCAGMNWLFGLTLLRPLWRLLGIRTPDELGNRCLFRTVRHVEHVGRWYKGARDGKPLIILYNTVQPEETEIDPRLVAILGVQG